MATIIQLRRDTAANWTAANPTLADGEKGWEKDTGKWKTGDGTTAWNSLDYETSEAPSVVETTGTVISFTAATIYNTATAPATGNITDDLTGAKVGIVQKIYHNHSTAPTVPAGWKLIGGAYEISVLNMIYAEWGKGTRVEYWITQEVVI